MKHSRGLQVLIGCVIGCATLPGSLVAVNPSSLHTQKHGNAEAEVFGENRESDRVETTLSGEITVILRVEGGGGLEVEPVQAVNASADWKERRRDKEAYTHFGTDGRRWEQKFQLEPKKPGELSLSLVPIRFREGPDEAWKTITWQPVPVKVTTQITNADPNQLRDISPPEPVSERQSDYHWLAWGGAGMLAAAVLFGAWEIKRRMAVAKPAVAPERRALAELERIQQLNLAATGDGIRHHTMVSEVARRYFEQRFHLKAPGKTTAEFLEALRQDNDLSPEQFTILRDALDQCDLAKFARVRPSAQECDELNRNVRALVKQTSRADSSGTVASEKL
jgi:hypothetical protein